ncbi:hypothetical protein UA24_04730 [Marinomonas sp. BSi20414]|nr:hypothetical protein [Marinomonas sp. BSi20414]
MLISPNEHNVLLFAIQITLIFSIENPSKNAQKMGHEPRLLNHDVSFTKVCIFKQLADQNLP